MQTGPRLRPTAILPSLITLGNLACGLGAFIWVMDAAAKNRPELLMYAGWLMVIAALFDGIDGKVARLTQGTSDLGAQLDSLCDAVTFGVAPAMLARGLVLLEGPGMELRMHPRLLVVTPILYACCAVLRLARFNAEDQGAEAGESDRSFIGLPSPAAAAVPITLVLTYFALSDPNLILPLSENQVFWLKATILRILPLILVLLGALMVSRIRYPHSLAWLRRTKRPFPRIAEIVLIGGILLVEPELTMLLVAFLFMATPAVTSLVAFLRRHGWLTSRP
ncbi:MAG: phosphatidylcholine/phosphatidylserine synthase [Planctomycetota bacterium]|nr:MAG: phosphatidylcholine/phosphatidylserine synthase [Planctomycetota bacterium]